MGFRHAIISVDVLYDDTISPAPSTLSLEELAREGISGSYSLITKDVTDEPLTIEQLRSACAAHGTDPDFFLHTDSE